MKPLEEYERRKGNMRDGVKVERNIRRQEQKNDLVCKIEGCGKRCKSKGGLKIHQKRMHGTERKEYRCVCGLLLWSENTLINHSKACTGERAETEGKRRCEKCGREFSKNNLARHRRKCTAGKSDGGVWVTQAAGETTRGDQPSVTSWVSNAPVR